MPTPKTSFQPKLMLTVVGLIALILPWLLAPPGASADVGGHGIYAFGPEVHGAYSFKERKFGVGGRLQTFYYRGGRSPLIFDIRYTYFFDDLQEVSLGVSGLRGDGRDYVVLMGGVSAGASLRMRPDEATDIGVEMGTTGAIFFAVPTPGVQAFLMGRFSRRHKLDLTAGVGLQYLIMASIPFP